MNINDQVFAYYLRGPISSLESVSATRGASGANEEEFYRNGFLRIFIGDFTDVQRKSY